MARLLLVMTLCLWLIAIVLGSDSSGSLAVVESGIGGGKATVDDNTTVVQPGADFIPKDNGGGNDEASKARVAPSDGNGGGLSKVAVGVIVVVSVMGLALGVTVVVCAWRTSRLEEEAMFMDLGDERNYTYGQFGDYAAM
ncbi:Inactive leucine-rich repeat receptor-like protein kinase [Phytophthora palmivora]|uniref:Inactive leucine-rich repeat receptor-like protein kinase n=1 Tax=Phytophthora palmivora TaxID=4796 RepID=A0A2P4XKB3_9STRA|nr:Inactive leucine-rich repeat receptor-like protein kinase [Phytophthora palmivora]